MLEYMTYIERTRVFSTGRTMVFLQSLIVASIFVCCYGDSCMDVLPDCREYTLTACDPPYRNWAYQNCAAYCGFCREPCDDVISDCAEYGAGACKAPYVSWAVKNCARSCGFCDLNKQKAQCVYSDWMTLSDCSVTCGSGFKTEVRSFLRVKDKTPGSKDCKEDLERYTKCELDSCPA